MKDTMLILKSFQMDHHLGCVNVVRWSGDGRWLASGGDDKLVMIWQKSAFGGGSIFGGGGKVHVEQWRLHQTLRGHDGDVLDLAWGPADAVLATASVDNNIIIWNTERFPDQISILRGHTSLVKGVFFDPVGKYLASQSDDKTMRIWKTSDWSQEAVIEEPFKESGATTHFLRPGWSPDGSIVVSAHAMNGGGPTAQIVERSSWKANRDFVGHKKAVSCVRFCHRVFEKPSKGENGKKEMFVLVALGSRDRSFSVWTTNLKRPFFVVNEAFDQGVVDVSWSSDGQVLLACSMDGTIAAAILSREEVGRPIPDSKLYELLKDQYGKNFGTIANLKSTSNLTNGGPVVIENPDMLKNKPATPSANGFDLSRSSVGGSSNTPTKNKMHPKGPTDKQIEARTSDGKRRITPIFIPMAAANENGAQPTTPQPFGISEFGSSSTQERSRIAIEKRDDIVQPNVSPSKLCGESAANATNNHENNSSGGSSEVVGKKKKEKETEPKVNTIQVKKKPSTVQEPPVNVIQVKKKPGPPKSPPKPKPASPGPSSNKKRKRIAVLSSDSSEDEEEPNEPVAKKMAPSDVKKDDPSKSSKLKDGKTKKPELMTLATTNELSPKRPRGRPPQNSHREATSSHDLKPGSTAPASNPPAAEANLQQPVVGRSTSIFKLPSLKMDKCKVYNFPMAQGKICITVNNNLLASKLHELTCSTDGQQTWSALTSSPIATVGASREIIIVVCKNGSLHLFSPQDRGQRLFPAIQLPSPVSKLTLSQEKLALVTTCCQLYIWDLVPRRPRILTKENVLSLFQSGGVDHVAKLLIQPQIIIVTGLGRSFTHDSDLGCWLNLTDTSSAIQSCSSYNSALANLPPEEGKDLPLASLSYLAPTNQGQTTSASGNVDEATKSLATLTHCRNQRLAAQYLKSPREYQYWLKAEIKHLAKVGDEQGLRTCLDWLMGHDGDGQEVYLMDGQLEKKALLREALELIKSNLHLQRLYVEYNDQIRSTNEVKEIDKLLDV